MPIARMRKTHIVNHGIENEQAGEQKHPVHTMTKGEYQSTESQQGGGEKQRCSGLLQCLDYGVAWCSVMVEDHGPECARGPTVGVLLHPLGSAGESRQAIPVEDELPKRHGTEMLRVVGDPLFYQPSLFGCVGRFTHFLVLTIEDRVLAGVGHVHPDAF